MTMEKRWVPVSLMGTLYDYGRATFDTKEAAEAWLGPMLDPLTEILEVDVNIDPMTNVGLQIIEDMKIDKRLENLLQFHASVTPEFLKMNGDERIQFIYDMMTIDTSDTSTCRPVDLSI